MNQPVRIIAWAISLILLVGGGLFASIITWQNGRSAPPGFPVDCYVYLTKAESLISGRGLSVNWGDGIDRKFFPGYSLYLAPFALMGGNGGAYWIPANLLACGMLLFFLWKLTRYLGFTSLWRLVILLAVLSNVVLLSWIFLPYAEILSTALALAAWCVAIHPRDYRRPVFRWLFSGLLLGAAFMTRPEAGIYLPFLILSSDKTGWRERFRPAVLILLWMPLLFLCWYATLQGGKQEDKGLAYVGMLQEHHIKGRQILDNFQTYVHLLFSRNIGSNFYKWLGLVKLYIWQFVLVAGLLGFLGRVAMRESGVLLIYALLHSFWPYFAERYLILVLPLAAIVLIRGLQFIATAGLFRTSYSLFIGILLLIFWIETGYDMGKKGQEHVLEYILNDIPTALSHGEVARMAGESLPEQRVILTDGGPMTAYYFPGEHVYFSHGSPPDYYADIRPQSARADLKHLGITHVLLRYHKLDVVLQEWEMGNDREQFNLLIGGPEWKLYEYRPDSDPGQP